MACLVSEAERVFTINAVLNNVRPDGRSFCEMRPFSLATDVVSTGGASVRLYSSDMDIYCCIKCEISQSPEKLVEVISETKKERSQYINEVLESLYSNTKFYETLEKKLLISSKYKHYWTLKVNLLYYNSNGNDLMLGSLAVWYAVQELFIPKVDVSEVESGLYEFTIQPETVITFKHNEFNFPLLISVFSIDGKLFIDPTALESNCAPISCHGGFYGDKLCLTMKDGSCSVKPDTLIAMINYIQNLLPQLMVKLTTTH